MLSSEENAKRAAQFRAGFLMVEIEGSIPELPQEIRILLAAHIWKHLQDGKHLESVEIEGVAIDGAAIGDWVVDFATRQDKPIRLEPAREIWLRREGQDIIEIAELLDQAEETLPERAATLAGWICHAIGSRPSTQRQVFIKDAGGTHLMIQAREITATIEA